MNHFLSDLCDPLLNKSDVQSVNRSKTCEDVGEEQADPEVVTVHGSQESGTDVEKTKRVSLDKHESLVQKQQSDPSLQHALRSTVSMQEAKDVPKCYSLHDAILFRKLKRIKLLLNKLFIARRFCTWIMSHWWAHECKENFGDM